MLKKAAIVFAVLMVSSSAWAFTERDYQTKWCNEHKGAIEYVLPDKTRVDCLTEDYAIEFDFARKWAEAYGQAMYYAKQTGKQPGIVLILESTDDERYLGRLKSLSECNTVKIWTITPEYLGGQ